MTMGWSQLLPAGMSKPAAPYSLGAKSADGWVHTAGLVAIDADGKTIGVGDIKAQTQEVLRLMRSIVETAGGTMADIVSVQIFIRNFADYAAMNDAYRAFFGDAAFPPRYCIRADLVKEEWLVEMAAVAKVG
ncbi:aminoacrylate peracid reductase [Beijerinckia sp. GAS462]|nr:aminoacrylate peracid reductase [Beijerinckia sp. GAS462]